MSTSRLVDALVSSTGQRTAEEAETVSTLPDRVYGTTQVITALETYKGDDWLFLGWSN